jgi:hypothetical protein
MEYTEPTSPGFVLGGINYWLYYHQFLLSSTFDFSGYRWGLYVTFTKTSRDVELDARHRGASSTGRSGRLSSPRTRKDVWGALPVHYYPLIGVDGLALQSDLLHEILDDAPVKWFWCKL